MSVQADRLPASHGQDSPQGHEGDSGERGGRHAAWAAPPAPGATAARSGAFARFGRALLPKRTPARLRAGLLLTVLVACCLAAVPAAMATAIGGDFQAMGQRDAPEVNAAAGLYFSLNDMDAQVANALLAGRASAFASNKTQAIATYNSDRATADADLQQAAVTAAGNATAQRELKTALDGMGEYESLAADALLADQQGAISSAGTSTQAAVALAEQAPPAAVSYYRQATSLMKSTILPNASQLTSVNAATLDNQYATGRSNAGTAIALAIVLGLALIAVLALLQLYLAVRFRRLVNPALAAATLLTLAVTITTAVRLGSQSSELYVAKSQAFDSIIALDQARAVTYDANADESRYLIDPGNAAWYQNSFLAKSQELVSVGNTTLSGYYGKLDSVIAAYQANHADVRFGGYLGTEFRNVTFPGEQAAAISTLLAYQVYVHDDRQLRALAKTNMPAAVGFDFGTATGQSDWAFNRYAAALGQVIAINESAFSTAIAAGEGGTTVTTVLPVAGALLTVILVFIGIRPRLAEYRIR